ncbi:MAG: carboxypeptidase-like regulatory domain-containing protein [Pyrinomonadaceae bacterium]
MLSKNLKVLRYVGVFIFAAAICSVLAFPMLRGESASPTTDDLQKQMQSVKTEMSTNGVSPALTTKFTQLANVLSKCGVANQVTEPTITAPFSPAAANICVNGALAVTDPTWVRPGVTSNNTTGIGACPGSNPAIYDFYSFNLTGCAAFPTDITATLCGPAGCAPVVNLDAVMYLYRNVPAGDTIQANGGLPGVFNPASPCTNFRGANDSLSGGASSTSPTGNTCNQATGVCLPACTGFTSLAGINRRMGNGRFTIVISGASTTDFGNYNLYVNAPAAGCNVALAPTAANASIGGRVLNANGNGIGKATITITGDGIQTMQARTNAFGYYNFDDIPTGGTYVLTISGTKTYTFSKPTRVVSLDNSVSDADFVSEQ